MSALTTLRKSELSPIRAVILDMDGVLFDTEGTSIESIIHIMHSLGFEITRQFIIGNMGRNMKELSAIYSEKFGAAFNPEQFWRIYWDTRNSLYDREGMPVKKGIPELLLAAKAHALPCIVASSSPKKEIWASLERAGIRNYFVDVVSGDMFERSKPNPDIFLVASSLTGMPPACCAVVEDSLNGMRAARAAGNIVIFVKDIVDYDASVLTGLCDYSFDSAAEIARIL